MVDHARLWRRAGSSKRHLARSRHGREVLRKTGFPSQLASGGLRCCCAVCIVQRYGVRCWCRNGARLEVNQEAATYWRIKTVLSQYVEQTQT